MQLNAPIPSGYCDITTQESGKLILNYLTAHQKQNPILPVFKGVYANCKKLMMGEIYPFGYIAVQKKIYKYKYQKDYNNAVSHLFGNTDFFDKYSKDFNKSAKEILKDQFDYNLKSEIKNIGKPKLLWKDDYAITFQTINQEITNNGNKFTAVVIGSSTIVKNAIIHTYITNDINKEPNALYLASLLIKNSKLISKIN